MKGYDWDGKELKHRFTLDFTKEKLGRPHIMRLGSKSLFECRCTDSPRSSSCFSA